MEPAMTWLSEAPMPIEVLMAPRVRLKRPLPCVRAAITRTETTPNISAATPARIWIAPSSTKRRKLNERREGGKAGAEREEHPFLAGLWPAAIQDRSEEHTSEIQSLSDL